MRESLLEKLQEAEACARCEHEKRLGIEQQRDELLAALTAVDEFAKNPDQLSRDHDGLLAQVRAIIAKVDGEK